MIKLIPQDFQWINGYDDDPEDHCVHGRVLLTINNIEFVKPEDGVWTISASALYLLRTITEDHTVENPVSEINFLFPCCGFSVWPHEGRFNVICIGCSKGMDLEITHQNEMVLVKSSVDSVLVSECEWKNAVQSFVDTVSDFYKKSQSKVEIVNDFDRQGWAAFWDEWNERYEKAFSIERN